MYLENALLSIHKEYVYRKEDSFYSKVTISNNFVMAIIPQQSYNLWLFIWKSQIIVKQNHLERYSRHSHILSNSIQVHPISVDYIAQKGSN